MDDDIVSLIVLTFIVNSSCREQGRSQDFSLAGSQIRGRGQARLKGPRAGRGLWGGCSQPPPHQLGSLGEPCKLPERGSPSVFLHFMDTMAFPGISVASGHVPVAKYF